MFGVLIVVFCRNRIAILRFSTGQRQISLIAVLHVLKALDSGREAADFQRLGWAPAGVAGLNGGLLLFRTSRSLMAPGTDTLRDAARL